jgi:single-strand DNA-binding protein
MICVEGSLRTGSYQDKKYQDVTHFTTEVFVDNVEFTGSKQERGTNGNSYNDGNNGYNNNYGGGYNNNYNNYQAPPMQAAPQQSAPANESMSYGNAGDFEEILSDGDVPF